MWTRQRHRGIGIAKEEEEGMGVWEEKGDDVSILTREEREMGSH